VSGGFGGFRPGTAGGGCCGLLRCHDFVVHVDDGITLVGGEIPGVPYGFGESCGFRFHKNGNWEPHSTGVGGYADSFTRLNGGSEGAIGFYLNDIGVGEDYCAAGNPGLGSMDMQVSGACGDLGYEPQIAGNSWHD